MLKVVRKLQCDKPFQLVQDCFPSTILFLLGSMPTPQIYSLVEENKASVRGTDTRGQVPFLIMLMNFYARFGSDIFRVEIPNDDYTYYCMYSKKKINVWVFSVFFKQYQLSSVPTMSRWGPPRCGYHPGAFQHQGHQSTCCEGTEDFLQLSVQHHSRRS